MASDNPYEIPSVPKFVDFNRMLAGQLDRTVGDNFFNVEETAARRGNAAEDKENRPNPRDSMTHDEKVAEAIEWIGLDRLAMFQPRQQPRRSHSVARGPTHAEEAASGQNVAQGTRGNGNGGVTTRAQAAAAGDHATVRHRARSCDVAGWALRDRNLPAFKPIVKKTASGQMNGDGQEGGATTGWRNATAGIIPRTFSGSVNGTIGGAPSVVGAEGEAAATGATARARVPSSGDGTAVAGAAARTRVRSSGAGMGVAGAGAGVRAAASGTAMAGGVVGRAARRSVPAYMGPETRSRTRMLQQLRQNQAEEGAKVPTGASEKKAVNKNVATGTKATVVTETKEEAAQGGAAVRASRNRTRRVTTNAVAPKGPMRVLPRTPATSNKAETIAPVGTQRQFRESVSRRAGSMSRERVTENVEEKSKKAAGPKSGVAAPAEKETPAKKDVASGGDVQPTKGAANPRRSFQFHPQPRHALNEQERDALFKRLSTPRSLPVKPPVDTSQKTPARVTTARRPSGIVPKSAEKVDASVDSAKGTRAARTDGVDKVTKRFGALKLDKRNVPPKRAGSETKLATLQPLPLPPPPRTRHRGAAAVEGDRPPYESVTVGLRARPITHRSVSAPRTSSSERNTRAAAAAAEHGDDDVRPKTAEPTDPHEDNVNNDRGDQ